MNDTQYHDLQDEDENISLVGSDARERNFCFIIYEDSAPKNWQDIISNWHIPAFISPYHDSDLLPSGAPKKPHYHVMVMCEGVKSSKQRDELIKMVHGVAPPGGWIPPSMRGYARYLCHLDDKNKHQYDTDLVISLSGANYQIIINLVEDKYKAVKEMKNWCKENQVYMYSDLLDYAAANNFAWFKSLCDNSTMVMMNYLRSLEYKHNKEEQTKLQELETQRHIDLLKTMHMQIEEDKKLNSFLINLPIEGE